MARENTPIRTVLVAGFGTMGRGVTKRFAGGGFDTYVLTRAPERITGLPDQAVPVKSLPPHAPDLVIECFPEDLDLKMQLFADVEAAYCGDCLMATNTSSLDLQSMADSLAYPTVFLGMHYFMPADVVSLVEVVCSSHTSAAVVDQVTAAVLKCGQKPVVLEKAVPGFLINRLQHAILHEAYWLIENEVATAETVDLAAKHMLGPRMCVTGLIQQKDLSGLDTHALAQAQLVPELHHGSQPSRLVQEKHARRELGVKTGRGFYDWTDVDVAAFKRNADRRLHAILEIVDEGE